MKRKIISIFVILTLILVIPTANAQLTIGAEVEQELIEVKINSKGEINVKHIIKASNMPGTLHIFSGTISNLVVTNEIGEEKEAGLANDGLGNQSIFILPSNQNSIITYNLENMKINNNLFITEISYPQKFSVVFEESINLIFLNNNVLFLDDKRGVAINGGGNMKIEFYSTESKIIEKATWEENKFDVEIITDSEIQSFNFNQPEKSLSFQVNDENKFVTITMSEELLGGPYVTLLDDEKIKYTKFVRDGGIVSLNLKPEATGQVTIIGTTVIPEFSMFIPLIMGFLIILTVPAMRKFSLR
ncbi:hypothetical protein OAL41_02275 [Nitrosopumilus sp.]|nr:hypothetical protein [Nitrosopumilus sp.]